MEDVCIVHVAEVLEPALFDALKVGLDPRIRLSYHDVPPFPVDFRILVAGRITEEMLTASPFLSAVIIPWAGIPLKARELLMRYPAVSVHNLHHNAQPTAEMAVALLLAAAKMVIPLDQMLRAGDWTPRFGKTPGLQLSGKTAVILGLGAIGRRTAALCASIGMQVVGVRRDTAQRVPGVEKIVSPSLLHKVLTEAQALLVCLPLTDSTTGMIGKAELALLPDQTIVVNVARGAVIQEEALFRELESGRLRAGLDVWYTYPTDEASRSQTLPSQFPFHSLPNVVMTPHIGGETDLTDSFWVAELQRLLNSAARGQPMPNRVDVRSGY